MSKKLMIVESPHKSKSITGFLSNDYTVIPTVGAMFDIENAKTDTEKAKYDSYGVDTKSWDLNLKCTNAKQLSIIRKELSSGKYDELIVSTDPDRAGSSIGQEVVDAMASIIKKNNIAVSRATWTEITKKAVEQGLQNKTTINQNEVDAAKARQTYDRLFGFAISGIVQKTVREKSAGRVQTPALRLIVDREKERLAFIKAEYHSITGTFKIDDTTLNAKLYSIGEQKIAVSASFDSKGSVKNNELIIDETKLEELTALLKTGKYQVADVTVKPYTRKPPPPYTTSSFQQDVGTRYRLSSKQTMNIAQRLYEASLISYMRTDSIELGSEAVFASRNEAIRLFGQDSVPEKPIFYKNRGKNVQAGHEAIRPVLNSAGKMSAPSAIRAKLNAIDKDAYKVYEAVYNRTVASAMNPAKGWTTTVRIASTNLPDPEKAVFTTAATQITEPGWTALTRLIEKDDDENNVIDNEIKPNSVALLKELEPKKHSTIPPARYLETSLVQKLAESGLGRPSTYATIVTINQTRGYVAKKGQQLYPNWSGFKVAQYLEGKIPAFVDYDYTANMEDELDLIEAGSMPKANFLVQEWGKIQTDVLGLDKDIDWDEVNALTTIKVAEPYQVRVNRFGAFLEKIGEPLGENGYPKGVKLGDDDNVYEKDFSDPAVCEDIYQRVNIVAEANELGVLTSGEYKGWVVTARSGKFGAYVQAKNPKNEKDKPINHTLPEDFTVESVTLEDITELFAETKLPRTLSDHFFVGIGKRGPWLGYKKTARSRSATFYSLPEEYNPRTMTVEDAQKVYDEKKK